MSLSYALVALLLSSPASAREYPFPPLTREDTRIVIEKSVPADTLVRHPAFTVKIPKGWSLHPVGPSERLEASLTATPTEDVKNDQTYFGIHLRNRPAAASLENRKESAVKLGRKARFLELDGRRWLELEYSMEGSLGKPLAVWALFTPHDGKEVIVLAGTPEKEREKHEATLRRIIESVRLSGK